MKKDRWGRPWLLGNEDGPDDALCFRCGRVPYTVANPFGTCLFEFTRAAEETTQPGRRAAFMLCDECVVTFWEWAHPEMAADPAYIAKKDQYQARVRLDRQTWNDHAPDRLQVGEEWHHGR